jgi:ABC-type multidrug transport system fused ATPase/permease subunit
LLRKPKIILLDEATAAVDTSTDKLIQLALRKEFKNITTLVVAHRLSNVMDCDEVLVMAQGLILEKGEPAKLVKDERSKFFAMMNDEDSMSK